MRAARLGGPIGLVVIGAILRFAVANMVPNVDLGMIGLILMAAGAVWFIIELVMARPRSTSTVQRTTVQSADGTPAQQVDRETHQEGL